MFSTFAICSPPRLEALSWVLALFLILTAVRRLVIFFWEFCRKGERHELTTGHEWEKQYNVAVLETDWSKIEECIQAAESAIRVRLDEFSLNRGGTPEENQAIADALNGLSVLRDEVAAWRGPKRAG